MSDAARENRIRAEVRFRGSSGTKTTRAILDTGAPCCMIPRQLANELGAPSSDVAVPIQYANGRTEDATHTRVHVLVAGAVTDELRVLALVSDTQLEPIIGLDVMRHFRIEIDSRTGQIKSTNGTFETLKTASAIIGVGVLAATAFHYVTGGHVPGSLIQSEPPPQGVVTRERVATRRPRTSSPQCRGSLANGAPCRYAAARGNYGYCRVHRAPSSRA